MARPDDLLDLPRGRYSPSPHCMEKGQGAVAVSLVDNAEREEER
jgi:hypothetical protein